MRPRECPVFGKKLFTDCSQRIVKSGKSRCCLLFGHVVHSRGLSRHWSRVTYGRGTPGDIFVRAIIQRRRLTERRGVHSNGPPLKLSARPTAVPVATTSKKPSGQDLVQGSPAFTQDLHATAARVHFRKAGIYRAFLVGGERGARLPASSRTSPWKRSVVEGALNSAPVAQHNCSARIMPRCRRQAEAPSALPQLRVTASVAGRQGMRTRRVMCPLLSQKVLLLARKGSSGAGWMLPSTSNARDRDLCARPGRASPSRTSRTSRHSHATFSCVAAGHRAAPPSRARRRFGPPPPRSARPRRRP